MELSKDADTKARKSEDKEELNLGPSNPRTSKEGELSQVDQNISSGGNIVPIKAIIFQ